MNFLLTRNSASFAAPDPSSSVTTSPCVRGGRASVDSTVVHAADRPTFSASTPRSASDQVSTGFFFAAMIPLNDGYRASPDWSVTLSTSGAVPSTTSVAVSPSRRIFTFEPSTVISEPKVTCGTPSRSASIAGTTLIDPSVEAIPHTTRSQGLSLPVFLIASASTSDVASASEPAIPSSTTWTPLSAPICRPFRIASAASAGPTVNTVTVTSPSAPSLCFCLICNACSMAYSSSSDNRPSTPSRSTVLSDSKCRSAVASGTYFTQTTM